MSFCISATKFGDLGQLESNKYVFSLQCRVKSHILPNIASNVKAWCIFLTYSMLIAGFLALKSEHFGVGWWFYSFHVNPGGEKKQQNPQKIQLQMHVEEGSEAFSPSSWIPQTLFKRAFSSLSGPVIVFWSSWFFVRSRIIFGTWRKGKSVLLRLLKACLGQPGGNL